MKIKILYAIGFWCILSVACQENEMTGFENDGAVYFQLNANDWREVADSIVYSFAGKDVTEYTVNLQVDLMGEAVDWDREVRVGIDPELTTAEESTHYRALETSYVLPAGAYTMQIPVTILGTDPRMENQAFQLAIRLEPSADLGLGLSQRTLARIQFSAMLTMPYYWDEFYWGKYSKVKHEKLIELLGVDFPATEDEYYDDDYYYTWDAYCNYLSQWFSENYPVYDEYGNPIDPWYIN
jgi:hypothetical protein